MEMTLGQQYNIREKPTVILYTYNILITMHSAMFHGVSYMKIF